MPARGINYANTGLTLVDNEEITIGKGSIVGAGAGHLLTNRQGAACAVDLHLLGSSTAAGSQSG